MSEGQGLFLPIELLEDDKDLRKKYGPVYGLLKQL